MREGEALRDGAACGAQAYDRRRAGHARADDASGAVDEDAVVAGLSASDGGADAVTGATWAAPENADVDATTSATWAEPQGGVARGEGFCERDEAGSSFDADVQEVIDAVTGATWGTRNHIMEDMFHKRLDQDASSVPTFAPPGEAL